MRAAGALGGKETRRLRQDLPYRMQITHPIGDLMRSLRMLPMARGARVRTRLLLIAWLFVHACSHQAPTLPRHSKRMCSYYLFHHERPGKGNERHEE